MTSLLFSALNGIRDALWRSQPLGGLLVVVALVSWTKKTPAPLLRAIASWAMLVAVAVPLEIIRPYFRAKQDASKLSSKTVRSTDFPDVGDLERMLHRIGSSGPRTTGSAAHESLISWIENELLQLPGLTIRSETYEILRWQTVNNAPLEDSATLRINGTAGTFHIPIAGAVPFSRPTRHVEGPMVYLRSDIRLSQENAGGKIVLRDFPTRVVPYVHAFLPSFYRTADLTADFLSAIDRPGQADEPIRNELILAGKVGATAVVYMFDLPRSQVASYFEPHQGVHYELPALFVGVDESIILKHQAKQQMNGKITLDAEIARASTRNLIATLPGQIEERIIYETHTDGNTYVQENGCVAVLALAKYFSHQSLSDRRRTLEFAFNTGHLHISREGTHRHALQLDSSFDETRDLALIIPVEHLGTREILALPRRHRPGRELGYTGRGEIMFWCVGPMPAVVEAVIAAVKRRRLDRVLVTRGLSIPSPRELPHFNLFGGIGTYYHHCLLPTTALVSGPWSLWAPAFGRDAIDICRLRSQALAVGDIYLALESLSREAVVGSYPNHRLQRRRGAKGPASLIPKEIANDSVVGER